MELKFLMFVLTLVASITGDLVRAEHPPAESWEYDCATMDKYILLGYVEEIITYGHVSDMGTANYAVTVYSGDMTGTYRVRAIGYARVAHPGCHSFRISEAALDPFLADLARHEKVSAFDLDVWLKQADGGVSLVCDKRGGQKNACYSGDRLGDRFLDLTDTAQFFESLRKDVERE